MDLLSAGQLWFFGAIAAGGLLGWLVGHFTRFEVGLGIGMLIPGVVAFWFVAQFLIAYHDFTAAGPMGVHGTVVAVEDRPSNASGSITHPVPRVRFRAPDGAVHVIDGPASGGYKAGDTVSVIHDPADPERSRVGQPSQLRGGAIAFGLFGTFLAPFGLLMLGGAIAASLSEPKVPRKPGMSDRAYQKAVAAAREQAKARAEAARRKAMTPFRERLLKQSLIGLNLALFAAILWPAFSSGEIERQLMVTFALVALAILGHGVRAAFVPGAGLGGALGMAVLALNFAMWSVALHLLF